MHNVAWDMHTYNWESKYSTSASAILTDQNSRISDMQTIRSGDGIMPVISLEGGNSTNGQTIDAGGNTEMQVSYGNPNLVGVAAWIWSQETSTLADNITINGSLTAYGQLIRSLIAQP
jgi:hypothetical protein